MYSIPTLQRLPWRRQVFLQYVAQRRLSDVLLRCAGGHDDRRVCGAYRRWEAETGSRLGIHGYYGCACRVCAGCGDEYRGMYKDLREG